MMNWEKSEKKAFEWFKNSYDNDAIYQGRNDSTISDIYSPLYNYYIEVKDITNGARCGQFTKSTIDNNPYAKAIYSGKNDEETCINFVIEHYKAKQVGAFIIVNNNNISLVPLCDLFNNYTFEIQEPYHKRSGTSSAPAKDRETLLKFNTAFYQKDNKIFCSDQSLFGTYCSVFNSEDYFISKTTGELRKRSNTNNMTWHIVIKEKIEN